MLENMKTAFNMAQEEYKIRINRMRDIDNKLNMLLIATSALFLIVKDASSFYLKMILMFLLVVTSILILIGLYPKSYSLISIKPMVKGEIFNKTEDEHMQYWFENINKAIEKIEKTMKIKIMLTNISTIILSFSFFGVFIGFII